ncbi:MAG: UDP-N-acetylmuramate dehydrogenase [Bacteroidaceae bacterium]
MFYYEQDYDLVHDNTFGIHANALYFVRYTDEQQLADAIGWHRSEVPALPWLHVGSGSNLLFLDDFPGVVLRSEIKGVEVTQSTDDWVLIRVGGGMEWDELVDLCVSHGWHGLENLSFIPGQVGAAAVQNIGAYGAEASQYIVAVECMDLSDASARRFEAGECGYGYRTSVFKTCLRGRYAVTRVWLRLNRRFVADTSYGGVADMLVSQGIAPASATAGQLREAIIRIRRQKLPDPAVQGNAGSFFMNPVVDEACKDRLLALYPSMPHYPAGTGGWKLSAGWLIEQSGWKGKRLGPVGVHDRQALVLVNLGGATGMDVAGLCQAIRQDVARLFGVTLVPEVNFIPDVLLTNLSF